MNTIIIGILLALPFPVNAQVKEIDIPKKEIFIEDRINKLYLAIEKKETGGNHNAIGASGEQGNLQFMPTTFNSLSIKYFGEKLELTPINQDLVAVKYLEDLISQGYSDYEIALIWNAGRPIEIKGVNKYGVEYDSKKYAESVMSILKTL